MPPAALITLACGSRCCQYAVLTCISPKEQTPVPSPQLVAFTSPPDSMTIMLAPRGMDTRGYLVLAACNSGRNRVIFSQSIPKEPPHGGRARIGPVGRRKVSGVVCAASAACGGSTGATGGSGAGLGASNSGGIVRAGGSGGESCLPNRSA